MDNIKDKTIKGFMWRLGQNFGTQGINFVIQIVLARLLLPEIYGVIALTAIFSALATVFIQGAFSSGIIQRKTINQVELSSIFYLSLMISLGFVGILFLISPMVSRFYHEPILIDVLRVQSINVFLGSLFTVHQSLLIRNMDYKKGFIIGILGTITQGTIGITLALSGFGIWALVLSSNANMLITFFVTILLVRWRPSWVFSFKAITGIFSYGSRIFIISLMNAIYTNLIFLFIGRIYDPQTLGYYSKGYGFPLLIMTNVDGAINTVLFSSLSKTQDDPEESLKVLRNSMKMSIFFSAPAMFGLAAVAQPMVILLMTEKWLPAVPFIQLVAMGCLLWPLSARMQAINAIGRSDIALKLNILLRVIGVIFLIIFSRFNIYILALSSILSELIIAIILSFFVKNMIGYSLNDQLKDVLPSIFIAGIMGVAVWSFTLIGLSPIVTLILQMSSGLALYALLAWIFKLESIEHIVQYVQTYIKNGRSS